jgi:2-succinyl-5-enolpyruvyl-6-hydroxy-3-cyclohexene-1-carboxylate synthase
VTVTAQLNREQALRIATTAIHGGVRHAVLSPGARNTPLVLALHDLRHAGWPIELHSVIDERSAGFYALGLARIRDEPVMVSCTSGSAGANYGPAVVEACEGQVPLIVVTADRPEELQNCGAPQTMNQVGLFGPHVRTELQLSTPSAKDDGPELVRAIAMAVAAARGPSPGPVHINARFRKPLWEPGAPTPAYDSPTRSESKKIPDRDAARAIDALLNAIGNRKGVIVAGPDPSRRCAADALLELAERLGWPILADPVSSVRNATDPGVIRHGDGLLRCEGFRTRFQPEVLLAVGGTPSSRPVHELFQRTPTVRIDPSTRPWDPWKTVTQTVRCNASDVLKHSGMDAIAPLPSAWRAHWGNADQRAAQAIGEISQSDVWEGAVVADLFPRLPPACLLRLASSMPIRDADSFGLRAPSSVRVTSNRGVNGIDGLVATSMGEAAAHAGPTVVLSGDLSFLHDSGSLATVPSPKHPLVLVVFDNRGGAIFSYLPMVNHPTGFTPWFTTPHQADIAAIARGHGLAVHQPTSVVGVRDAVATALERSGISVVHVRIDADRSKERHERTWQAIAEAVQKGL